jgi:hypothetical protein
VVHNSFGTIGLNPLLCAFEIAPQVSSTRMPLRFCQSLRKLDFYSGRAEECSWYCLIEKAAHKRPRIIYALKSVKGDVLAVQGGEGHHIMT